MERDFSLILVLVKPKESKGESERKSKLFTERKFKAPKVRYRLRRKIEIH